MFGIVFWRIQIGIQAKAFHFPIQVMSLRVGPWPRIEAFYHSAQEFARIKGIVCHFSCKFCEFFEKNSSETKMSTRPTSEMEKPLMYFAYMINHG